MSDTKQQEEAPVGKLVRVFIKMRDKRDQLRKKFETEEAEIEEQMDMVKAELLKACESLGASSFRTDHGQVIRTVKTRYWATDWAAMHEFLKENDALDLLERRIHQTNMKQYLEAHPDQLPPGLNADSHYEVTVRRS